MESKPTEFEQRAYAAAARHIDRGQEAHDLARLKAAETVEAANDVARREIDRAQATIRRVSRRRAKREANGAT